MGLLPATSAERERDRLGLVPRVGCRSRRSPESRSDGSLPLRPTPEVSRDHIRSLMLALSSRNRIGKGVGANWILPLHGGAGALLKRSASLRLVTIVTQADVDVPVGSVAGWLERRQARRSALLVVPDRPCGVAIALRWGLDPERFRLAEDFERAVPESPILRTGKGRPWHSRR